MKMEQDNILIKILKQNDKYSIVDNYTSEELKKLGYTSEEIKSRKTLTLYDEILKNATWEYYNYVTKILNYYYKLKNYWQ